MPATDEAKEAVKYMANRKTVGLDKLSAELLKLLLDDYGGLIRFHDTTVDTWSGGKLPQKWKDAVIMVLHEKEKADFGNYRGIFLVAHTGKVVIKTICRRLSEYCEVKRVLPDAQCGFQPRRSTVDIMLVVRRLQEISQR